MRDILGVLVSTGFVVLVLVVAQLMVTRRIVTAPVARKIIHISVAHWWLIAMAMNESLVAALIGPVFFVAFNFVAKKLDLMRALEPKGESSYGTVYFPISLIVLVFFTFGGHFATAVGAVGCLVLGYGDGLATLFGRALRSPRLRIFGATKTVAGSATMFLASAVVVYVVAVLSEFPAGPAILAALATAAVATVLEAATPFGLDNITVPIGSALFYGIMFAPV